MSGRVVIAEDNNDLNKSLGDLLSQEGYSCSNHTDPLTALEDIDENDYDVLLTDLKMPGLDGIELAEKVLQLRPDMRVIIMTAFSSMPSVIKALRLGVDNYILKPFNIKELLFQINKSMEKKKMELENKRYRKGLENLVEEMTSDLLVTQQNFSVSQLESIFAIGNILEARDFYTRGHTERVALYACATAEAMGWEPRKIYCLGIGSPLHDIGKVGIPDSILKKPGALTDAEYENMKEHCLIGYEMVKDTNFPVGIINCILQHHERYDGKGYPFGLKGRNISQEGRLLAIVDAFDAMTSSRVYRKGMPMEKALGIIESEAGGQFDPKYVKVFLNLHEKGVIRNILEKEDYIHEFKKLVNNIVNMKVPANA
jgi:putative two-component system response regulator